MSLMLNLQIKANSLIQTLACNHVVITFTEIIQNTLSPIATPDTLTLG
mgnify:CR=1 FL=1